MSTVVSQILSVILVQTLVRCPVDQATCRHDQHGFGEMTLLPCSPVAYRDTEVHIDLKYCQIFPDCGSLSSLVYPAHNPKDDPVRGTPGGHSGIISSLSGIYTLKVCNWFGILTMVFSGGHLVAPWHCLFGFQAP